MFTLTHTTDRFLIFPYVFPLYFSLIVLFSTINCILLDLFFCWKILVDYSLHLSSLLFSLFNHYYFSPSKPIACVFLLKKQHFSSCHFSLNFSSILASANSSWLCCSLAVITALFFPSWEHWGDWYRQWNFQEKVSKSSIWRNGVLLSSSCLFEWTFIWCTQAWAQKEALLLCAERVSHEQVRIGSLTVKSMLVPMEVSVHLVLIQSCRQRLQSS